MGVDGPRQARLFVYAHEYPESQLPTVRESSHPSSIDAKRVCVPRCCAAT
jgi:hypothetical protein